MRKSEKQKRNVVEVSSKRYSLKLPSAPEEPDRSTPVSRKRAFASQEVQYSSSSPTPVRREPASPPSNLSKRPPKVSPKPIRSNPSQIKEILLECTKHQAKLHMHLKEFSNSSISVRMGESLRRTANEDDSLDEAQDLARRRLSAQHLAAQERVAKMILRAALSVVESVKQAPSLSTMDDAQKFMLRILKGFRADVVRI
jgi:hypothetical protein